MSRKTVTRMSGGLIEVRVDYELVGLVLAEKARRARLRLRNDEADEPNNPGDTHA